MNYCDILKISDNEIQWLTGEEDYTDGVNWILERFPIPLILVSMGKEGSRAYYKGSMVEVAPFLQKNTIETTGAGDTFGGCVLHYILEHGMENLTEENLKEMLRFANAAAALITTSSGATAMTPCCRICSRNSPSNCLWKSAKLSISTHSVPLLSLMSCHVPRAGSV